LVNPYDVEEMADTILKAFRMSDADRTARMKRMRRVVREENVFWWVDSFLRVGAKLTARASRAASRRSAPANASSLLKDSTCGRHLESRR
jgi:trehalose-6-phosphate synthase